MPDVKSISWTEYTPSPDAELFETSLLGSIPITADRIRAFSAVNPSLSTYAIAQALGVTKTQVASALKARRK